MLNFFYTNRYYIFNEQNYTISAFEGQYDSVVCYENDFFAKRGDIKICAVLLQVQITLTILIYDISPQP